MSARKKGTLGIIAGDGDLPRLIINHCHEQKRDFVVITFKEQTYEKDFTDIQAGQNLHVSMGAVKQYVNFLKTHKVSEIIMGGSMERPNLWALRPDKLGVKIFSKLLRTPQGDDGFLQQVIAELESLTGAKVIGYEDLFGAIEWPLGALGKYEPNDEDFQNIARAEEVFDALAECDIGQALVVQAGLVIGVEAIEGTEKLLQRCAPLLRKKGRGGSGGRGLLFKKMKPHQTRKADLPTIGGETIAQVKAAGLQGIIIGQSGVIILNYKSVIKAADSAKIFFYVIP